MSETSHSPPGSRAREVAAEAAVRVRLASRRLWRRALGSTVGRRRAPAEPRAWVGAFGKHPCAADHLTDLPGDGPPSLGEVAAALYFGGIRGEIAAGVWEEFEHDGAAIPFGHDFAHRPAGRPGHLVLGRLWASRDGVRPRPRTDFPMVAVAELRGDGPPAAEVLAVLREFETVCRSTEEREEVAAGLDAARRRLAGLEAGEGDATEMTFAAAGRFPLPAGGVTWRGLPAGGWAFVADGRPWLDVVRGPTQPADFRSLRDGRPPPTGA